MPTTWTDEGCARHGLAPCIDPECIAAAGGSVYGAELADAERLADSHDAATVDDLVDQLADHITAHGYDRTCTQLLTVASDRTGLAVAVIRGDVQQRLLARGVHSDLSCWDGECPFITTDLSPWDDTHGATPQDVETIATAVAHTLGLIGPGSCYLCHLTTSEGDQP